MSGRCYALVYTSSRGTTHYRVDQETGCRAIEDATKYTKSVADFLRRPNETVRMVRASHAGDVEWGDLPDPGAEPSSGDGEA